LKVINPLLANLLTISGNQPKRTKIIFYSLLVNILANFWLIPKYSIIGAAYSALITQFFISSAFTFMIYRLKLIPRSKRRDK
jgi:O-antigen/teichoic acid export membrane protein